MLALVAGFGSRHPRPGARGARRAPRRRTATSPTCSPSAAACSARSCGTRSRSTRRSEHCGAGPIGFASVFAGINEVLVRTELGEPWAALQVVDLLRRPALQTVDRIPEGPVMLDWLSGLGARRREPRPAGRGADRRAQLRPDPRDGDARRPHAVRAPARPDPRARGRGRQRPSHLLREAVGLPGIWRDSWLPLILADLAIALRAVRRPRRRRRGDRRGPTDRFGAPVAAGAGCGSRRRSCGTPRRTPDGAVTIAREVAQRAQRARRRRRGVGRLVRRDALRRRRRGRVARRAAAAARASRAGLQQDHARAVVARDLAALDAVARRYWSVGLRWYAIETVARHDPHAGRRGAADDRGGGAARAVGGGGAGAAARGTGVADASTSLTSREREVVALAARGLPDRGVAEELGISVRTAQTHLSRAFTKLGVHRRSELVGLLDDGS